MTDSTSRPYAATLAYIRAGRFRVEPTSALRPSELSTAERNSRIAELSAQLDKANQLVEDLQAQIDALLNDDLPSCSCPSWTDPADYDGPEDYADAAKSATCPLHN